MKKILIFLFIFIHIFLFSQEMTTYYEINGYYQINYPSSWSVSENLDNNNQVSFYPQNESMVSGVIFVNLNIKSDAKYILEKTLKYLGITNIGDSHIFTEDELTKWNADSGSSVLFNMNQYEIDYRCILIIFTKETFYYSLMFVITASYINENQEDAFEIVYNITNSFKILK